MSEYYFEKACPAAGAAARIDASSLQCGRRVVASRNIRRGELVLKSASEAALFFTFTCGSVFVVTVFLKRQNFDAAIAR